MIKQTPRIVLTGDEEEASYREREGIRQLDILKGLMKFQELNQDARRVRYTDGSEVTCCSVFGVDEINIYVPEKEEEEVELELYRFFAKVRKGGLYGEVSYYWIRFVKRKGEINVEAISVKASDRNMHGISVELTLWALSNLPRYMNHAATKAFMLDKSKEGEDPKLERWVATQHALTTNTTIVFYPLYCALPPGSDNFVYPYPWELGGDLKGGFVHPAPPTRFYCDIEKGLMAWYSAKTVEHPTHPSYPPIDLVFGLLLKIDRGFIVGMKTFECNSLEVDGEGFEAFRSLRESDLGGPPTLNPLPLEPEVPVGMMSEVNSISDTELEVIVPWGYRPIKYILDLTKPDLKVQEVDHTYLAVTSCDHWHWTEEGFGQKLFANLFQEDKGDNPDDYVERSGSGSGSSCGGDTEGDCVGSGCHAGATGNVNNLSHSTNQRIDYSSIDLKSLINTHIFDAIQESGSIAMAGRKVYEHRDYIWQYCSWNDFLEECLGSYNANNLQERYIEETTRQKKVDSVEAEWSSPNVAFLGSEIRRRRADNSAFQKPTAPGYNWSGSSVAAFAPCFNRDTFANCSSDIISGGVCFYGYPFPNTDWADDVSITETIRLITYGYEWHIYQGADEYSTTPIVEFRVDGEETFSLSEYNRTYYLDDRSSENSEGLLVAARGAIIGGYTPAWNYPIFDVDRWSIVYKFPCDEEFVDVTNKLLEVLNCDETELIELGLI